MIVKKNQYIFSMMLGITTFVFVSLISFGFFLGFTIDVNNIIIYLSIVFGVIIIDIIASFIFSLCRKTYYEISKENIILWKHGKIIEKYDVKEIKRAEYRRFGIKVIIGVASFGDIKIIFNDGKVLYFDVSLRKVKKMNDYFRIFIYSW